MMAIAMSERKNLAIWPLLSFCADVAAPHGAGNLLFRGDRGVFVINESHGHI
jgi:hypothetical protein